MCYLRAYRLSNKKGKWQAMRTRNDYKKFVKENDANAAKDIVEAEETALIISKSSDYLCNSKVCSQSTAM